MRSPKVILPACAIFMCLLQTHAAIQDTLLKPVNSETRADCSCGKINDLEKAKSGEFPWIVRLVSKNDVTSEPLCWGSLINSRYVLSAAHCTSRYSPLEVEVQMTGNSLTQNPTREVATMKNHPGFQIGNHTYDNDVSLIKLRQDFDLELGDVIPVCLPRLAPPDFATNETKYNHTLHNQECDYPDILENRTMTMSEFKGFHTVDRAILPHFDKMNIHILRNGTCSHQYPTRIKAQVFCGEVHKSSKDPDKCHGDSGTPLVYLRKMKNSCDRDFNHTSAVQLDAMKFRFIQLGLVTMQPKRDCKSKSQLRPVVLFTRLSRYISWIRNNVDDGTFCINSPD